MTKDEIIIMPEFFDRYINQVEEPTIFDALQASIKGIKNLDVNKLKRIGDKVYEPGKWTIKDIFQHMADTERIHTYRALRFARKDSTILPGFDEELFGKNSYAGNRSLEDILHEYAVLKESTFLLYSGFDKSALQNTGICFHQNISVLALGFVIAGHQTHHLRVIKERYEPLL